MSDERSAGGSQIYRYADRVKPTGDVAHANDRRIVEHVERHFGPGGIVFHEIVSDRVHVDVHLFPANEKHHFQLLVTSGMSALPMTVPPQMPHAETFKFAEVCVLLDAAWPLTNAAMEDERLYWPIRLLKTLARFPHAPEIFGSIDPARASVF